MTIILASIMLPKFIASIGLYSTYANRISFISSFLKLPQENKVRMMQEVLNDKSIQAECLSAEYYYDPDDSFEKSIEEELKQIIEALEEDETLF